MIELIILITVFVMLLIATGYDLKWRYVPDYASYSFIAIAIIERVLYAIELNSLEPIKWVIPSVIIMAGTGYSLYKSGMWGGGDVKIIISVAILLAWFPNESIPMFINFFINLMIIGAAYILPVTFFIGLRKVKPSRKQSILMIAGLIISLTLLNLTLSLTNLLIALSLIIITSLPYLKTIESKCFINPANMNTLMDGDWLVEEVRVDRRVIKPRKEGLTRDEAELIKKWWRQGKLKDKPLIKEGVAYLPAFLITFLVTLFFGNLILLMVIEGLPNSSELINLLQ